MSNDKCKNCKKCKTPEVCHSLTRNATYHQHPSVTTERTLLLTAALFSLTALLSLPLLFAANYYGSPTYHMAPRHGRVWVNFDNTPNHPTPSSTNSGSQQDLGQLKQDGSMATPANAAATMVFAAQLLGLSETDAVSVATQYGFGTRVVARDGVNLIVTGDYFPQRIDLALDGGIVTSIEVG